MRTTLTFSEVRERMMEAGLRYRQAVVLLQRGVPEPLKHNLHKRRLWDTGVVERWCARVRADGLGEALR